VLEKLDELAVDEHGDAQVVNDGVDDSNGETQLLRLERLFHEYVPEVRDQEGASAQYTGFFLYRGSFA
jgi:hypothetical protein